MQSVFKISVKFFWL